MHFAVNRSLLGDEPLSAKETRKRFSCLGDGPLSAKEARKHFASLPSQGGCRRKPMIQGAVPFVEWGLRPVFSTELMLAGTCSCGRYYSLST